MFKGRDWTLGLINVLVIISVILNIYIWSHVFEEINNLPLQIQSELNNSLRDGISKQVDSDMKEELKKQIDAINYQQGMLDAAGVANSITIQRLGNA